ncbi:MAG: GlsB/YeaQ/YmgE family stress response membrane protein [Pirellulaceae bacterium]|nr:GlsB/YeaQ/YmgE family stress response membrane protein [Pirellulaceae bacterium]
MEIEFPEHMQGWINDLLVWVGFGTLVGLLAKAIMPGRDPGGAIATLAMGIGGTIIGCGVVAYFYDGIRIVPISPGGMLVATAGAFIILCFYRLLSGYWFVEGEHPRRGRRIFRGGRSRRRRPALHYDDF